MSDSPDCGNVIPGGIDRGSSFDGDVNHGINGDTNDSEESLGIDLLSVMIAASAFPQLRWQGKRPVPACAHKSKTHMSLNTEMVGSRSPKCQWHR